MAHIPLPLPTQGDGDTPQGLVRITVKKASMGHDRPDPYQNARPAFWGVSPGGGRAWPRAIKSSYPETSHTISSE